MSKGNTILINGNFGNGRFVTGIITDTSKPGTQMEIVPATEPSNGMYSFRACSTQGANQPAFILLEDENQGVTMTTAYVANAIGRLYAPISGDELNLLYADVAGTGDTHAIGDLVIVNNAGKFIATTGTPYKKHQCEETSAALTADTLLATRWN